MSTHDDISIITAAFPGDDEPPATGLPAPGPAQDPVVEPKSPDHAPQAGAQLGQGTPGVAPSPRAPSTPQELHVLQGGITVDHEHKLAVLEWAYDELSRKLPLARRMDEIAGLTRNYLSKVYRLAGPEQKFLIDTIAEFLEPILAVPSHTGALYDRVEERLTATWGCDTPMMREFWLSLMAAFAGVSVPKLKRQLYDYRRSDRDRKRNGAPLTHHELIELETRVAEKTAQMEKAREVYEQAAADLSAPKRRPF